MCGWVQEALSLCSWSIWSPYSASCADRTTHKARKAPNNTVTQQFWITENKRNVFSKNIILSTRNTICIHYIHLQFHLNCQSYWCECLVCMKNSQICFPGWFRRNVRITSTQSHQIWLCPVIAIKRDMDLGLGFWQTRITLHISHSFETKWSQPQQFFIVWLNYNSQDVSCNQWHLITSISTKTVWEIHIDTMQFSRAWGCSFDKSRQWLHEGSFITSLCMSVLTPTPVHLEEPKITYTYFNYM